MGFRDILSIGVSLLRNLLLQLVLLLVGILRYTALSSMKYSEI